MRKLLLGLVALLVAVAAVVVIALHRGGSDGPAPITAATGTGTGTGSGPGTATVGSGSPTASGAPPSGGPAPTAYVTVLFGRSAWVSAARCVPLAGAPTLGDAVAWLAGQGVPAAGGVIPGYLKQSSRTCQKNYIVYPSWADLESLHTRYGFQAISQSQNYDDWDTLSTTQQFAADSCATLAEFPAHGFTRAWGMFAYPDDVQNNVYAQQAVTGCFAFGRKYGVQPTARSAALTAPYLVHTLSVTGGRCNDPAGACAGAYTDTGGLYMLPGQLHAMLDPAPGQYAGVQFYRFVAGRNTTGPVTWDCTAADPREHWTSAAEDYCYADFQQAITGRSRTAVFTDPATVAQAWGRVPAQR